MRRPLLLLCCLLVSLPVLAQNRDTDGDGLPDVLEKALGSDPGFAERLLQIASDKTRAEGDTVGTNNYSAGLDVTAVSLGNCAQDRYLWRIDFAGPYEPANSGLIIYLDADSNPKTGRSDMGCEYMIVFAQGSGSLRCFSPEGAETPGSFRGAALGNSLYLCTDLKLQQVDGQSKGVFSILHETKQPYAMVDTLGKTAFTAPGESSRPKYVTPADETRTRNFSTSWGFRRLEALKRDPQVVPLPSWEGRLRGYELNVQTEYVNRHVRQVGPAPHTVTVTVPRSGRYWLGFFTYQSPGRKNFVLRLNGRELGLAVADEGNNRQCLFFTNDPQEVKQGDELELECVYGNALVEELLLAPRQPQTVALGTELDEPDLRTVLLPDGRLVGEVTTVTQRAAVMTMECRPWPAQREDEPQCNHRFWLNDVVPGRKYKVKVTIDGGMWIEVDYVPKAPELPPSGGRGRLPLTCRNSYSQPLTSWPVTQGVPFPWGRLGSTDNLRLLDAAGHEIPLQATVLGYWPDYSIKWVLLDFQADLPAGQTSAFSLEYGKGVSRRPAAAGLQIEQGEGSLTVNTGRLRAELTADRPGYLGRLWLDRNGDGRFAEEELVSGADEGRTRVSVGGKEGGNAGTRARLTVLRRGPLHCIVRVDGTLSAGEASFGDQLELHFYAGKAWIASNHTFTNTNGKSLFSNLDSLYLCRQLNLGGEVRGRFAAEQGEGAAPVAAAVPAGGATLWQGFDDSYRITGLGADRTGKRAGNWADATGSKAGVTVALRYLWQLYPKSVTLRPDGIDIGLMPRFAPGTYKVSTEGQLEDKLYYYLKDDAYRLKYGVSKRHELLWMFHDAQSQPSAAEAAAFDEPPLLKADPAWYCDSKAFGDILKSSPELGGIFATYEAGVSRAADQFLTSRERGREYGMLNFGDWWGERGRNWGNIEYDTQYAFYLQFVRSGDECFYRLAEQAARHNRDVDMIWAGDKHRVGKVYAHCIGHTGDYYDHEVKGQGSPGGGCSVSHSWCEGYLADYFLSGDVRGLEAATALADVYDGSYTANYDFDNNRTNGWHLILTMGQYRATGDPYYLNAARIIVARTKEREAPGGGWIREMMPGHCLCLPRHRGEAAFMMGILLSGLRDYNAEAHDPTVDDMIARGAHYLIRACWVPEKKTMRYTSCPVSSSGGGLSELITEGMMEGYLKRPDKVLGEVVRVGTVEAVRSVDGFGKSFTQQIRRTPSILYQFAHADLDNYDFAPGQSVQMLLKVSDDRGFSIALRPRGKAAGKLGGKVTLRRGEQVVAQAALDRRPAVVLEVPGSSGAGMYTLQVEPAGNVPWDVDCNLDKQIVDCSRGVRFGPGVRLPSYLVFVPADARTVLTLAAQGPGTYRAQVSAPGGKRLQAELKRKPTTLVLDAAQGFAGLCQLDLTAPGPFSIRIDGSLPYLSYWPNQMFAPGEPVPAFDVHGNLGPGGSPELRFDAGATSDADSDILSYLWDFGDGSRGEGRSATHRYAKTGSYQVTLTVTDKPGSSRSTKRSVSVPPAWVLALTAEQATIVEAEAFSGQGKGEVSIVERPGCNGRMVTRWEADLGHWLEWQVKVPAEGEYNVILRYCNGTEGGSRRELTVDGQTALPDFRSVVLPFTGGYSTDRDDFRYYRLPGAGAASDDGPAARLHLSAGPHTLRLSNLGGGLGLDQLMLVPAER